jgi:hypothetical protein
MSSMGMQMKGSTSRRSNSVSRVESGTVRHGIQRDTCGSWVEWCAGTLERACAAGTFVGVSPKILYIQPPGVCIHFANKDLGVVSYPILLEPTPGCRTGAGGFTTHGGSLWAFPPFFPGGSPGSPGFIFKTHDSFHSFKNRRMIATAGGKHDKPASSTASSSDPALAAFRS